MTDSSQIRKIETPVNHSTYDHLDYLNTDMLFIRRNKQLSPEKYEHLTNSFDENEGTGVFDNKMIGFPNRNAIFDGFARKFNDYIKRESNWKVMRAGTDEGEREDGTDDFFQLLKFQGAVDGRLSRDQENVTSEYAYSKSTKQGEKDHEITYSYILDSDKAVQKMKWFTHDTGDGQFGDGKTRKNNLAVNHQNAIKWIAWQVRRFLEAQKQDFQNRYMSTFKDDGTPFGDNYLYPEFDDVNSVNESYGIMFFVEGTRYIEGDIPEFEKYAIGNIIIGDYNIGEEGYQGDVDVIDPDNTTVWYSQFDIVSISTHSYNGQDLLDITVVIPEGIALNNKAQVAQVNTLGKQDGAQVEFTLDSKEQEIKRSYQIDGLVQSGLPKNFIAKFKLVPISDRRTNYWRGAINRTFSILGIANWADSGQSIQNEFQNILVTTDGRYGEIQPYYASNQSNLFLPADYIGTKLDTKIIGSLNRIIYRTTSGFKVKFDRSATSLDLTKRFPLATILAIKSDYYTGEAPHLFYDRTIKLLFNNHYYSVTMRPVKPIYTHPITGYFGDPMPHYTALRTLQDIQQFVLNYTTANPDYTIFTNDGNYLDIRYTNSGQRSILFKQNHSYFDYASNSDFSQGRFYVNDDLGRIWFTLSNLDLNRSRSVNDNDPQYRDSGRGPMRAGNHDIDYEDWQYFRGWPDQTLQPAVILEYNVNNTGWRRARSWNSPKTLDNYADLRNGDVIDIRWSNINDFEDKLPQSFRMSTVNPSESLFLNDNLQANGHINAKYDIPLFGDYQFNTSDGTGDVSKEALFLGNAIPVIQGHKRLYAGQNDDGSMNKVEVENNNLDLSTVPVNLGIVFRELRYI